MIKLASFLDYFSWIQQPSLFPEPQYNVAPSEQIPVVTAENGPAQITLMRWGLVPSWSKDASITAGSRMINARAESLPQKPAFSRFLKRKRCLIPANGFYEWKQNPGHKGKTPYYFHLQDDRPFAFAGLFDCWLSPDGSELSTCTIITTSANSMMQGFHHRMPVILRNEDCHPWVSPGELSETQIAQMLQPYPADQMAVHPVSTQVNKPGVNSPALMQPVELKPPAQPMLFG